MDKPNRVRYQFAVNRQNYRFNEGMGIGHPSPRPLSCPNHLPLPPPPPLISFFTLHSPCTSLPSAVTDCLAAAVHPPYCATHPALLSRRPPPLAKEPMDGACQKEKAFIRRRSSLTIPCQAKNMLIV